MEESYKTFPIKTFRSFKIEIIPFCITQLPVFYYKIIIFFISYTFLILQNLAVFGYAKHMKKLLLIVPVLFFLGSCSSPFGGEDRVETDMKNEVVRDAASPLPKSVEEMTPEIVQPLGQNVVWEKIEPGLFFAQVSLNLSPDFVQNAQKAKRDFMLVSIDPKLYSFEIYQNTDKEKAKTIRDIQKQEKATVTVNGAFFDEKFQPLSYLKSGDEVLHKLSHAELVNGVFTIDKNAKAYVYETDDFAALSDEEIAKIAFAIQNGPLLLDENGASKILSDTKKEAARTALGITKDGKILIILLKPGVFNSDNTLSMYQFARVLKENEVFRDMGLHSVLNLDGGISSGLMVGERYYPEMEKVQNVIVVKKTQK